MTRNTIMLQKTQELMAINIQRKINYIILLPHQYILI